MLDTIARKELADKEIDVNDFMSIQSKIQDLTPKLYADVSEIASQIDDYICNRDFRVKYEDVLKNGIDAEANKKISVLTSENNSLRSENQSLKEKNDSLSKENQSLKKENQSLMKVKDSFKTANESLLQEKAALQSTIDQLKKELESASKKQSKTSSSTSSKFCNVIDLGLPSGTLWADRNIGADSPEKAGYYFAWGEINPKNGKYDWDSYTYHDNPEILPPSNDAATQNWGEEWCMPTREQFDELIENCKWKWDGKGYKVIGQNGNSIYLPAAGAKWPTLELVGQYGYYWSSSLYEGNSYYAWNLYFDSDGRGTGNGSRNLGFSVRAVRCRK